MKAVTKVYFFDDEGEKFFGEGPARLLRTVEELGSLRLAAISMGMAYTKALKLVKQMEKALGTSVLIRTTGGKGGGGSRLSEEGKRWLERYEAYRDACTAASQKIYREMFPEEQICANTGCVIMASGLGARFGGNKLMADFLGKPLIMHVLDATEDLFAKRVVVTRHKDVAEICRERGIDVVLHDLPHKSDTVRLGLETLGNADCCMFCPGDQPLLRRETLAAMLKSWTAQQDKIWRPACGEVPGSPVLFPKWAFNELLNLGEGKGGSVVLNRHPAEICTLQIDDPLELMDADTPQMLDQLKRSRL